MILIFGREGEPPRVITNVTDIRFIKKYFMWWRGKQTLGLAMDIEWMQRRYTRVFGIERGKLHHIVGEANARRTDQFLTS